MTLIKDISQAFSAHAHEYEAVADVQFEIGQRLFERLDYLNIDPRYILDAGCGPGTFLQPLKQRYPKAQIVAFDVAFAMLMQAKTKQKWLKKWHTVNGDIHHLPFATGQFDLIFSNQVLHWSPSMAMVFKEFNRVLRPGGCLMFTTLGPDTFQELRQAFSTVDAYGHVNEFYDMHHMGDCLLAERFEDPVVDMERLTAHYGSLRDLLQGLKAQGVRNVHAKRHAGLTGKDSWNKFEQSMATMVTATQKYPLTYEVVYGQAWKSQHHPAEQGTETRISVAELKASLQQNRTYEKR